MTVKRDTIVDSILEVINNPPEKEIQGIHVRAWKGLERKQAIAIAEALKIWHKQKIKKVKEKLDKQ